MYIINKSEQPRVVPEKYNVLWQDYNDHLRDMLHTMRKFDEFTDVTLICDDQREIHAHKVVLSACSPVLKAILQRKDYGIPIVYLKGIKFPEMESILQFMYLGQTTVDQQRITSFLDVAKNLEIKELSENIKVQKPAAEPSARIVQLPMSPVPANQINFRQSQAPQSIIIPKAKGTWEVDPSLQIQTSPQVRLPSQRVDRSLTKILDKVKLKSTGTPTDTRDTKEEFAKCGICHQVFRNAKVFMQHYKAAHSDASESKSEQEDNPDEPTEILQNEIEQQMLENKTNQSEDEAGGIKVEVKQPQTVAIPPPELVYECQKCGFNSTSKDELKAEHPKKQSIQRNRAKDLLYQAKIMPASCANTSQQIKPLLPITLPMSTVRK